jgi:myo-inositol-1(or 4)-monophosphatase
MVESGILDTAKDAARRAFRIQRDRFGAPGRIEWKGGTELVTEVDVACEEAIVALIRERYPDHDLLGEESGASGTGSPHRWIIDPLDGTTNFAHGFPVFAVSIAYAYEGVVQAAACGLPMWDQLFWGARGQGAFLGDHPIHVSDQDAFHRALLATGFPTDQQGGAPDNFATFTRVSQQVQAVRRPGAAVVDLCYVACGGFDGFWEHRLKPWDTAAGALLVEEAGGRVTNLAGGAWDPDQPIIVASNGRLHEPLLAALAGD